MTETVVMDRELQAPGLAPRRTIRLQGWMILLVTAAAFVTAYMTVFASSRELLYPIYTFSMTAVFGLGVVRHRPARPAAFWLFAVGMISTGLGDVVYFAYQPLFGIETPYPSLADALYVGAYAFWAAGLGLLVRGRRVGRDVGGWIDTGIAITAFALVEFVFLIYPYLWMSEEPFLSRAVSAAYPIGDVAMLAVLARLLVSPGSRTASFRFLAAGFAATLSSDLVYGVMSMNGEYAPGAVDLGWMTCYTLFACAALHPSVRDLSRPLRDTARRLTARRIATLAALALVAPALFAYTAGRSLAAPLAVAISVGGAVLFLLVVARMVGLVRAVDRSLDEVLVAHEERDRMWRGTLRASEDQQQQLAARLHDGPVQGLTALLYRLQSVRSKADFDAPVLDSRLATVQEGISAEVADLRRMMSSLRPGALVERGLGGAVADYARDVSVATTVSCEVDVRVPRRFDHEMEVLIYRVAQDAVTYASERTGDDRVLVSLSDDGAEVDLEVAYFDAGPATSGEDALFGLRQRVEMVGGRLSVTGGDDARSIHARFPVEVAR